MGALESIENYEKIISLHIYNQTLYTYRIKLFIDRKNDALIRVVADFFNQTRVGCTLKEFTFKTCLIAFNIYNHFVLTEHLGVRPLAQQLHGGCESTSSSNSSSN